MNHLNYISRAGSVELEDPYGHRLAGSEAVRELGRDWIARSTLHSDRYLESSLSQGYIFSAPMGVDPLKVEGAVRAFATNQHADRHDYIFALHTDTPHPHVHLTINTLGKDGRRLHPATKGLQNCRESFAEELRHRGVEIEASPRALRGISQRSEPLTVRKMRERFERGEGEEPRIIKAAKREALKSLIQKDGPRPKEVALLEERAVIRKFYANLGRRLELSLDPKDRSLAGAIARFLKDMPPVESHRQKLMRQLETEILRREPRRTQGRTRDR